MLEYELSKKTHKDLRNIKKAFNEKWKLNEDCTGGGVVVVLLLCCVAVVVS